MLIHGQQLKPPGGHLLLAGGGHIGGVVHQRTHRSARLGDHPVQLLHPHLEGLVDPLRLCDGEPLALHQLVDIQPVTLGRGHPPSGGVGLFQIAQLRQIRQLVANGGGADAAHLRGNGLGTHRLCSTDIVLHHHFQYLLFPVCEFHKKHLWSKLSHAGFSTPFSGVLKRVYHHAPSLSTDGYKQIVNKCHRIFEHFPRLRKSKTGRLPRPVFRLTWSPCPLSPAWPPPPAGAASPSAEGLAAAPAVEAPAAPSAPAA